MTPRPQPRTRSAPVEVAAALVWVDAARIVVQQRPEGAGFGAGAWEFPGGKVEPGETPRAALARELAEEWGPVGEAVEIGRGLAPLVHDYGPEGPFVRLHLFHARLPAALGRDAALARIPPPLAGRVWIRRTANLAPGAFLEADRPVVEALADGRLRCPFAAPQRRDPT